MRAVLRFLALAVVLLVVAYAIGSIPGSIAGQAGSWRFETTNNVFVALLLAVLVVLALLARAVATVLRLPGRFGVAAELRRRRRGDAALTASLLALASGEVGDAKREATRARRLLGATPQTLLAGAEADRLAGELDGATAGYKALSERRDSAFLGLRGLIGVAVARNDAAAAGDLFRRAEQVRPGTRWIRDERLALACRDGDWSGALPLASDDRARAALGTAAAEAETEPVLALRLARTAHRLAPDLPSAGLAHARRLREAGKEARALAVLRDTWQRTPQPALPAFALVPLADRLARVKAAELFAAKAPGSLEAALLMGRVCLDAGMWGEARRHAEAARGRPHGDERRVHLLLADIALADGGLSEPERRALHAEHLRAAADAPASPAWHCQACGAEHAAWRPVCTNCRTIGRIDWTVDPAARGQRPTGTPTPEAPLLLGTGPAVAR